MIRLARYLKEFKLNVTIGPLCKLTEAIFELIVPLVMAKIIDVGIANGDTEYIWKHGLILVLLAVLGLSCALVCQYMASVDSGEWNVGETVRFGYYSQEGIALDSTKKVADAVTELAEDIDLGEGRRIAPMQYLQRFLFSPADQQKYIYTLSGGERCRLHLATVLMRQPNFLILDEPTNDLDIITLGILEEYLSEFKGCVIVVSHDRYFLDNIVDHLFVMEGNGVVRDFPGNYSDYRAYLDSVSQQQTAETRREQAAGETRRSTAERPARMSFKERKEFEALEAELEALNAEKAALEEFFASGETTDSDDFNRRSQRYAALGDIIDEKELRWLELSEKA